MENKTNVMRILDRMKLPYKPHYYGDTDAVSGMEVALALNCDPNRLYKTLVAVGASKKYFVFMVPVNKELNLKQAAAGINEKSIEMIKSKDLLAITGYIHGGCSPIGMKKQFITTIDANAKNHQEIFFSAGKIGYQIEMLASDLAKAIELRYDNIAL